MYLLLHPELIKEVLITKQASFHKSKPFQELETLLGKALLLSEEDDHLQQRRFLQPSFTQHHIQSYANTMGETTLEFLGNWGYQEKE